MESSNPYGTPQVPGQRASDSFRSVRRIDPISVGSMLGVMYVFVGLIVGGVVAMLALFGIIAGGGEAAVGGLVLAIGAIVVLPVGYGVMGFIFGVLGALLYNVVASFVGGIRIELG